MNQNELNAGLVEAADAGSLQTVQKFVEAGAQIGGYHNRYTALIKAAGKGHTEIVRWLLDKGADIEQRALDSQWSPLMFAAKNGRLTAVMLLLERGADAQAVNKDGHNAEWLARDAQSGGAAKLLKAATDNNPREIAYSYPLQDRILQEVFNFDRKERISLVRSSPVGDVQAMQRESFSDLSDTSGLRRAFEEHRKRGGKMTEEDVFGNVLSKAKLSRPAMPPP